MLVPKWVIIFPNCRFFNLTAKMKWVGQLDAYSILLLTWEHSLLSIMVVYQKQLIVVKTSTLFFEDHYEILLTLLLLISQSKRHKQSIFSYISAHLANQNYNVCIRRNNGKCSICYITSVTPTAADAATAPASFGLSK